MKFLEPSGFIWLWTVPALVLLYFMKLRRKEVKVSASFLWEAAARQARVDSFFQRLRVNLLLLLQILALLALIMALSRPYREVTGRAAASSIIAFDLSASMAAEGRFEKARREALRLVDRAPKGAEFMLVGAEKKPRVLVPFTRDRSEVRRHIEKLQPKAVEGDPEALRALAMALLNNHPQSRFFLLGDQLPPLPLPENFIFVNLGEKQENAAISAFSVETQEDKLVAFATITNHSEQVVEREVVLRRGLQTIHTERLLIPGGDHRSLLLHLNEARPGDFQLRIKPADALTLDDQAFFVVEPPSELRVRVHGDNRFLERALVALPEARVFRAGSPGEFQLEAYAKPPEGLPETSAVMLGVPPDWLHGAPAEENFARLAASGHPLVDGIPLTDIACMIPPEIKLPQEAEVLATVSGRPAIILLSGKRGFSLLFNFELYRSQLPLTPAFPILLRRFVDEKVRPTGFRFPANVETGRALELKLDGPLEVRGPEGRRQRFEGGAQRFVAPFPRPGVYHLHHGTEQRQVAANFFSNTESDLTPSADHDTSQEPQAAVKQRSVKEYAFELALFCWFLLLAEWLLYHRRGGS